jgi:hypothetical protein
VKNNMDNNVKYKVLFLINDTFEVVENTNYPDESEPQWTFCYQGSLADCEAYIRLKESEIVGFDY